MLLHTVVRNLKILETVGPQDTVGAGEHCSSKRQSLSVLWKPSLSINDVQSLVLLSDSWCVDLASCVFCWHSRIFLHDHFPPVSYTPHHCRYCIWKMKQEMKH